MLNHVMVGTNDIDRSKTFYDAVLATLGAEEGFRNSAATGHARVFYRHGGLAFGVAEPIDGEPATCANGATIGFACDSPEQVEAFHAAGVANGGTSIESPPGVRQSGAMGSLYLAYLRDPDGNKVCAIHRMPA